MLPLAAHRAPPRGRYDRALTPGARTEQASLRVILATADVLAGSDPSRVTVSAIAARAGVGRNTFYEHFRDAHAAIQAVETRAVEWLRELTGAATEGARTPLERLRAAVRAWLDAMESQPSLVRAALRDDVSHGASALSPLGRLFCDTLHGFVSEARVGGTLSLSPDPVRLVACAAAAEAISRSFLDRRTTKADAAATFIDVVLRVFR